MRTTVKVSEVTDELHKAKFGLIREAKRMCGKEYVSIAFEDPEIGIPDAGSGLALVFRYRVITKVNGFGPAQFWSMAI